MRLIYIVALILLPALLFAQKSDLIVEGGTPPDTLMLKYHSPGKAALFSLFPGGGQFYNKKYWKIPIIYTGLFISGGYVFSNSKQFKSYKAEAINRYNYGIVVDYPELSDQEVLNYKDQYEYQRNLSFLIFLGVYLLNIVDATVDAYFFEFDVSNDVTFRAEPYFHQSETYSTTPINVGLSLSLKF
jgi:hypothetical protein